MKLYRDTYSQFSDSFREQHHDIVLQDVFHHVLVYLLFPPNCACGLRDSRELTRESKGIKEPKCSCSIYREKALLSLTVDYYNRVFEASHHGEGSQEMFSQAIAKPATAPHEASSQTTIPQMERLTAMRLLLQVPEDTYFRKAYTESYPLWLIHRNLTQRTEDNHFKIVDRLGWTMLRLSKAYKRYFNEPRASLKEAVNLILGQTPIKTGVKSLQKDYLCGEKAYGKMLTQYKSVTHFILALTHMGDDISLLSPHTSAQITQFLNLSLWFRNQLIQLITPNTKQSKLFPDDLLVPLPSWVTCTNISLPIEPLEEKVQTIKEMIA